MSDKMTAAEVLRKYQKQCDPDGVEVQVSRQALDEVLDLLEANAAEIAYWKDEANQWMGACEERDAEMLKAKNEKLSAFTPHEAGVLLDCLLQMDWADTEPELRKKLKRMEQETA